MLGFFLLVLAISIPFFLIGGNRLPIPVNLPVSALAFVAPVIAASILTYRRRGWSGVRDLLRKALDYRKIKDKAWYVPILLLLPLIYLLAYALMRLAGRPLPAPQIPLLAVPVIFLLYLIPAACEELGWMGYAIDPLQGRWGALRAALMLGAFWAIWHAIPYAQAHNTANWILWQSIYTVATRVLIVWIYNNTGKSVFGSILFHDVSNVCWTLFPNYGSAYDPFFTGLLTTLAAALVAWRWGPRTLSGPRQARDG